jgi:hypothetical protein
LRRGVFLTPLVLALAWLALSPLARAQCNDGCDTTHGNTFQGVFALGANTTGSANTAFGDTALNFNTTGFDNTAVGFDALQVNKTGTDNTATGFGALFKNTASGNTAFGGSALEFNTTGSLNTATGQGALNKNTTGSENTADGQGALAGSTTASDNTATGFSALKADTTGPNNTANGFQALNKNTTGGSNTACGWNALSANTTGSSNIAIGVSAGSGLTTGSNNIDIAAVGGAAESNTTRLGKFGVQKNAYIIGVSGVTVAGGVGVIIDTSGHLGTVVSSARYKDNIQPMDRASEAILALQPVTFHYKKDLDPQGIPQFGLVAEEVEKVDPKLVAHDDKGKPYSVRYEAVNAMLLNEFLKDHRKVEEQERQIREQEAAINRLDSTVAKQEDLRSTIAEQEKEIKALTTGLQKVTNQLELAKPAARVLASNQ